MAATPLSPQASPRLPSPPPIAEDQVGPTSPSPSKTTAGGALDATVNLDNGASRRIRPGTSSSDMPEGPPVIDISEIDTAYQLTEHLKALYNAEINPTDSEITVPVDHDIAVRLATPPKDIDRAIWLYELCRFLCQKVNSIIIALFADEPPCSAQTCNEMRASEWQYLCAVHDPPKPCCAIDYCCHTLDWAANVLTSQKHFPSRMALRSEQGASHQQMRQLTNIFRRVYRIFAHAWFQHRDMFWKVEARSGLYMFFKTVCDVYSLIPEDNYTIPPEAEGKEPEHNRQHQSIDDLPSLTNVSIASRTEDLHSNSGVSGLAISSLPLVVSSNSHINTGHTTKRHRQTPSLDAGAISTVPEESEEDDSKSVAESVITTIEEDSRDIATVTESKSAQPNLGEVISSTDPSTSTEREVAKANDPLSFQMEEMTDLQQSATAIRIMDEAIEAAEAKEKAGGLIEAKEPQSHAMESCEPKEAISLKDATSSANVSDTVKEEPNASAVSSGVAAVELKSTSPLGKDGSPKLRGEELKSKIPVAKKDTPSKDTKVPEQKSKEEQISTSSASS